MNKKILIMCLAVLGLVVLSGCSVGGKAKEYCIRNGYSSGEWIYGGFNSDMSFYCTKEIRSEVINDIEYYNIKGCNKKICPKPEYHHHEPKVEHPKIGIKKPEVIIINKEIGCEAEIGDIYYDSNLNRFSQIREKVKSGYKVSETMFYGDSKTSINENTLPCIYLYNYFEYVYDVSKYAEYVGGIGWRIK